MQYVFVLLVAAAVFGICYLVDKGFTKLFRSQQQHQSGLSVRHSKHYGSIGLVVAVLGLAAVFSRSAHRKAHADPQIVLEIPQRVLGHLTAAAA